MVFVTGKALPGILHPVSGTALQERRAQIAEYNGEQAIFLDF